MTRLLALCLLLPALGWADTCPDLSNTSELGSWEVAFGSFAAPGDTNTFAGAAYQGITTGNIFCFYHNTQIDPHTQRTLFFITDSVMYESPANNNDAERKHWQNAIFIAGIELGCKSDKVGDCRFYKKPPIHSCAHGTSGTWPYCKPN